MSTDVLASRHALQHAHKGEHLIHITCISLLCTCYFLADKLPAGKRDTKTESRAHDKDQDTLLAGVFGMMEVKMAATIAFFHVVKQGYHRLSGGYDY